MRPMVDSLSPRTPRANQISGIAVTTPEAPRRSVVKAPWPSAPVPLTPTNAISPSPSGATSEVSTRRPTSGSIPATFRKSP